MEYEDFISAECLDFLLARVNEEGTRLIFEIQQLGKNPIREPDFANSDSFGEINGVIVDYYAVYRVDHAAKMLMILDVTYADQI